MAESNDASTEYLTHREFIAASSGADEMLEWLSRQKPAAGADNAVAMPYKAIPEPEGKPLDPFPTPKPVPADPSLAGTVMRSAGEIPKQIAGGIDDAARNALGVLDPLANWLNENVADLRYDPVAKPKTTTGAVTRSVSEFLTGFIPALKSLRAAGMTGKVAAPVLASAISDFTVKDPHEARLSNLWNEAGLPRSVLTDYLAANDGDTALEGRFKSAVESAFVGLAAEGVVLGARAIKAAKGVKTLDDVDRSLLTAKYGELTDDAFKSLGDPSKPMIQTVVKQPSAAVGKIEKGVDATAATVPDDLLARGLIDAGESNLYINFARIDGPDDVKSLIGSVANKFKGSVDEARRGTISQAETVKLADELGMSVTDLLERRKGQPFNAEEAVAARKLWAASGEKLLEAAKKAADPNAGAVDQFTFRKMMATHYAIQAEVIGARTETARALASWRIPAGGAVEKARAIEQVMQAMGGPAASTEMARRLAILAENGATPAALAKFAEKGALATTFDAVREVWINGLLSAPATHIVNATSNLGVAFQQIYERGVAAQISALRGTEGGVAPGEAIAMAYGLVSSIKDAFRMSWMSFKTGETGAALNKVDLPFQRAVTSEAFGMSSESGLGRTVDFLGEVARVPSRFLGAEDEFFKTIGYRAELHAQALRKATAEGRSGPELYRRMNELLIDTPENLRIAAADAALYNTFTNAPGGLGQALMSMREKVPAVTFVLPFVRTPVNIARYAFERSPFAPLVAQWRDDIAAGGARADLALARMATGTSIMTMALDWADTGVISGKGPANQAEREAMMRQGWQPYSVRVGDRWVSYNRTDPFGSLMGFAADSAEAIRRGEMDDDSVDEWQEVMAMGITAVSQVAVNKTYLRGLADFTNVMADPKRYGEGYVNNLVASFVPYTSLAGAVERVNDPVAREASTPWQAVNAKLLGLSEQLPPKRNLWGEEIRTESGLGKAYDFLSPAASREIKPTPIDTELMRLATSPTVGTSMPPQRIAKKTSFDGVQVNFKNWPDVFDEYVRLAGNDVQHPAWGMGAKDYLNAVISGNSPMSTVYQTRSDEMKLAFISKTVADYRQIAQRAVLSDPRFEDFARHVAQLKADKMQRRMPVLN